MRTRLVLAAVIVLVFAGSYVARAFLAESTRREVATTADPRGIVSLAPSITETLFALGVGDRVVGVTRYCDYPPAATQKPQVGGYHNPNYEAVVALDPDLVVILAPGERQSSAFRTLGLPTLVVNHKSIAGILRSIAALGTACGAEDEAARIVADIEARLERVRQKTAGLARPRVLFAVDRTGGTGHIQDLYIAGRDRHLDKSITLAGGQNAYQQGTVHYPVISTEGLLKMNPEVIIDMTPDLVGEDVARQELLADWNELAQVDAVRRGRVYLLEDEFASVPGPRFILLVEKLASMIHPQVDWQP